MRGALIRIGELAGIAATRFPATTLGRRRGDVGARALAVAALPIVAMLGRAGVAIGRRRRHRRRRNCR